MRRSEFVDDVARKARLPRADVERVIRAIFDTTDGAIAEAVRSKGSLSIPGFGRFTGAARSTRTGRSSQRPEIAFEPSRWLNSRAAGGSNGELSASMPDDSDEITPEEAAIRRRLVEGFERVRGMEIEDVFPGGWSDEKNKIRP